MVLVTLLHSGATAAGPTPSHATCPKSDRHTEKTHDPAAKRELVARGAESILICRYHGLNPASRSGRLEAVRRIVRRRSIASVARLFNQARALPPTGIGRCRADFGAKVVAYFQYTKTREWAVVTDLTGCELTSNGQILRESLRLHRYLIRLTNFTYGPNS